MRFNVEARIIRPELVYLYYCFAIFSSPYAAIKCPEVEHFHTFIFLVIYFLYIHQPHLNLTAHDLKLLKMDIVYTISTFR